MESIENIYFITLNLVRDRSHALDIILDYLTNKNDSDDYLYYLAVNGHLHKGRTNFDNSYLEIEMNDFPNLDVDSMISDYFRQLKNKFQKEFSLVEGDIIND